MYDRTPDVSDEDLGIRAFQVKRAKSVERSIERMRQGLGPAWRELSDAEIEELEWVLGELWGYVPRAEWDQLAFGHLTISKVVQILTFGSQLRRHARNTVEILRDIEAIVRQKDEAPSAE